MGGDGSRLRLRFQKYRSRVVLFIAVHASHPHRNTRGREGAVFALDFLFFFRGHAVTYRDIPEGDSTLRPHLDLFSATER